MSDRTPDQQSTPKPERRQKFPPCEGCGATFSYYSEVIAHKCPDWPAK